MSAQPLVQIRSTAIDSLLTRLEVESQSANEGVPVTVDLSELRYLERGAGAILSNALIGTLGLCPLKVELPEVRAADWLGATGLAFALANRTGVTTLAGPHADFDLTPWRHQWFPGREVFGEVERVPTLFGPEEAGETIIEPDLESATYAAFIDPHLSTDIMIQDHPVNTIVWPWLARLLPRARLGLSDRDLRESFIAEVGRLVTEMVQNVSQHAMPGRRDVRSIVHVSLTRGGGTSSFNRLHLTVHDTGPGILSTARPKLRPDLRARLDDHQLLFKLFDGSLPPWDRARGLGLRKIVSICKRRKGALLVATQSSRLRGHSQPPYLLTSRSDFNLHGTVLAVMLPLP